MRTTIGIAGSGIVLAGALLGTPRVATASPESELLVAKGEVAYHQGRYGEARALFEQAVAADGNDADAHHGLGRTFVALEQWEAAVDAFERALALRPGFARARDALAEARAGAGLAAEPARPRPERAEQEEERAPELADRRARTRKRWEIHASTGVLYDTNVTLAPGGRERLGLEERDDVAFILSGGARYDVVARPNALLRLEYDLYQTLHVDVDDFDLLAQRIRGTASYALRPSVWIGIQGGYNRYHLGGDSYLAEPFGMPFLSLLEGGWGLTQVTYRHGDDTYFSTPFNDVRDGPSDAVGASQTFYWGERYLTVGYQHEQQNPTPTAGNDFQLVSNQGYVQLGFPAWWQTALDFVYLYRYDDYMRPNSEAGFRRSRLDNGNYFYASMRRPLTEHVSVGVVYTGTWNVSNIELFDYDRNVVTGLLEVSY
jgi:tetratricopeptide (TPR) repeat protein